MHTRTKLLLAALTAALALTMGASTANAARSFSVTNNVLLTYISPGLTFLGIESRQQSICAVTLTASLHATSAKARGTLVGFVNGGRTANCRNNLGTAARTILLVDHRLPWHITLETFGGTLPRITEILVIINRARILFELAEPFGRIQGCLYVGDIPTGTSGTFGVAEYTLRLLLPLRSTWTLFEDRLNVSFGRCDRTFEFRGTFEATLPPIIRLI